MVHIPIISDEKGSRTDIISQDMDDRRIYLVGEITAEVATVAVAQLLHLAAKGEEDIRLYINSPGGSVSAGMAIYDTMQFITPDVATVCVGQAASMGAVLLSGGAKGKRAILKHSEVMIHQPSGGSEGQATDMVIAAEHIKRTKKMLTELLAENCERTSQEVERDVERDYWMNAEEALQYGIVDRIVAKAEKEA